MNGLVAELLLTAMFFPLSYASLFTTLQDNPDEEEDTVDDTSPDDLTVNFFLAALIYCCHWTQLFLALNRFIAVRCPQVYQQSFSGKRLVLAMAFLSWVIAFAFCVPSYAHDLLAKTGWYFVPSSFDLDGHVGNSSTNSNVTSAHLSHLVHGKINLKKSLDYVHSIVGVYFPAVIIGVLYVALFVKITRFRRPGNLENTRQNLTKGPHGSGGADAARRRRLVIANMLLTSYCFYLLCFIPTPIIVTFFPAVYDNLLVQTWTRTLDVLGHAATAVIYLALNKDYRAGLNSLLGSCITVCCLRQNSILPQEIPMAPAALVVSPDAPMNPDVYL
ncbi:hypothetical protein RvY_10483-2 [Ramazzottius varieornatus]|nr:hypothetical protein RvY_10483-2 [Ramazzottius varieornatus]